jgi:hypothetical protein
MNRAIRMRNRISTFALMSLLTVGCHRGENPTTQCSPCTEPLSAAQKITLSGGVTNPGSRTLQPGETVSKVVAENFPNPPGKPVTIVLIRQAPEGRTRQLIQLDASGKLMDPKQDWALRNGDEIVFPGGQGSDAEHAPAAH